MTTEPTEPPTPEPESGFDPPVPTPIPKPPPQFPASYSQILANYGGAKGLPVMSEHQAAHVVACELLRAAGTIVYRLERLERLMEKGLHQSADDDHDRSSRRPTLVEKARAKRQRRIIK